MIKLGLTGSIGMGKTTTANFFREFGIAVHDADAVVHDLYENEAVEPIGALFPGTVKNGAIDRQTLGKIVLSDATQMEKLEALVHPLVRRKEDAFIAHHEKTGDHLVVLDIPLLFETGANMRVDKVLVVTAPESVQRERVLARKDMTLEKLETILARQTPDSEKRARADFIIDTSLGMESAKAAVRSIIDELKKTAG